MTKTREDDWRPRFADQAIQNCCWNEMNYAALVFSFKKPFKQFQKTLNAKIPCAFYFDLFPNFASATYSVAK